MKPVWFFFTLHLDKRKRESYALTLLVIVHHHQWSHGDVKGSMAAREVVGRPVGDRAEQRRFRGSRPGTRSWSAPSAEVPSSKVPNPQMLTLRCSGDPPGGQEPETLICLLDVSLFTNTESRQTDFIDDLNCKLKP